MSTKLSMIEELSLAILKDKPKGSSNAKQIHAKLPVGAKISVDNIYQALLSLTQKKIIKQTEKGHFQYVFPKKKITGKVQLMRSGDAYILLNDGNEAYVRKAVYDNVLPNDLVEIEIYGKGNKPAAKIIKIIERGQTKVNGILDIHSNAAFIITDKNKFAFDVKISGNVDKKHDGKKAIATLTDWPEKSRLPLAGNVQILGTPGENNTEMHSIVLEFGFRTEFDEATLQESNAYGKEAIAGKESRIDCRNKTTFTIDPADAKDFDDALSFETLDNGNYEIGVHIADVSHYVLPNSALDKEALMRGTSVYLADRTIPMLPENLSNELCSLKPNVDRLAFSAIFEMDNNAKIISRKFSKTWIHSNHRFSYEQAQVIIEKQEGIYANELTILNALAKKLHAERNKHGAMNFETVEIRFKLDENGKPLEILQKRRFDAHKLIEEFMLLANKEVAEFVKKKQKPELPFMYRTHDLPQHEKLIELGKFCQLFGYKLDLSNEKRIRESINKLLQDVENKPEASILQSMAIRSMAKAIYTTKNAWHFGLAFDYYTHFTSPIRRYPDLICHRILQEYLLNKTDVIKLDALEQIAQHSSNMEQKAAEAERASTKYKMAEYLQQFIGKQFDAVITGLTDWGIYAEIIENKCEGLIRLQDISSDRFEFYPEKKIVKGRRTGQTFEYGDIISIIVKKTDPSMRVIDFEIDL